MNEAPVRQEDRSVQEEKPACPLCQSREERTEPCWSVYILRCADGTLYCGITTDVARRMAMHNGLLPGGARYTRGRRPVRLIACREGLERSQALRIEACIKRFPREKKVEALEGSGSLFLKGR